jgi:DNA-binding transcriptional MerR regulator
LLIVKPSAIGEHDMRFYKQRDIQKIFDDTPGKTLIYWAREGFVEWVGETKDARGLHRTYSFWNVIQFAVVRELAEMGISFITIRMVMDLWFKDFLQGPPRPSMRPGLKRRKGNASASEILQKIIVIGKHRIGRGWKGEDVFEVKIAEVGQFIREHENRVSFLMLNLPMISEQVMSRIKAAGLE